jgi:putative membrane protein
LKSIPLAVAAVILLSACARRVPEPAMATAPDPPAADAAARAYLQAAGSADLFESQAAQIALKRSRDPGVRSLAQMLASDHSQLASQAASAAQSVGTASPSWVLPEQATLLAQLQVASPREFDDVYRNMVVMAHLQAFNLHQGFAASGANQLLQSYALAAAGSEQAHLIQAQSLVISPSPAVRAPSFRGPGERG